MSMRHVKFGQSLSQREREVVGLVAQRNTREEIGQRLGITPGSVKSYVRAARRKLGASDITQLLKIVKEQGLLDASS